MISKRERRHFEGIAEAETALNAESIRSAAERPPGVNIEIGLSLSDFARGFGADLSRPDETPLVRLWRAREIRTGPRG